MRCELGRNGPCLHAHRLPILANVTNNVSGKRCLPRLLVAGLAAVLLLFAASSSSNVRAVEPGVNCSSYSGPGGVCVIEIGDIWLCEPGYQDAVCPTSIVAGDAVRWNYPSSGVLIHTTTSCGSDCDSPADAPLWDSGTMNPGDTFEYTFTVPGIYLYQCTFHPTTQRGLIRVLAPDATPTPQGLTGDANCSGGIDSIDAALVLQLVAGLVGSLSCEENADVNTDGAVNSIDATLILQHIVGLLPTLPP